MDLTSQQISSSARVIDNNLKAFSINNSLGKTELTNHRIELLDGTRPFREKARRHPQLHVQEAKRQIKEMLKEEVVQPSQSPWCSEFVMVKKKTGDWRMCVDFRKLNSVTRKDSYPLPNLDECLENLAGNQYFSQIDFASGYWQVPVEKSSQALTAFRVGGELYEFKRLPFGLTNAPATFQRLMNALFAGLKGIQLQIFLDDVCLASPSWEEHLVLLDQVLKIVIKANLKLKPSKCSFGTKYVKFLGHEISQQGIKPDHDKVRAILELPPPIDVSGVRRILGCFGFYQKFIPNFAQTVEPMVKLTRKKTKFQWGEKEHRAFEEIKNKLTR